MMTNLFSTFDPLSSTLLNLNWMISFLIILIIPQKFWIKNNLKLTLMNKLTTNLKKEMKPIISTNTNKGLMILNMSMFIMICLTNYMGLLPYIFTSSSHLSMTLSIALPWWLSMMLFGWIKKTNSMFSHLIPSNTPLMLMPFMVIIESISNLIRPITLSVRLAANMMAGHLILTLIENSSTSIQISTQPIMIILIQTPMFILESAVALIQSYVFSILMILYFSEIN